MDATNSLNRIIYGKQTGSDAFDILGFSEPMNPQDVLVLRSYVSLSPIPVPSASKSQAVGVFKAPDDGFVLARTHIQNEDLLRPVYEYVMLSRADLQVMSGNIHALVDLVDYPIPPYESTRVKITPLPLPGIPTWTIDKRVLALGALLAQHHGDSRRVLALLGAALHERGVAITNFKGSLNERVELVQGLLLLLPSITRPDLTFSTHVSDTAKARARIVFVDAPPAQNSKPQHENDKQPDAPAAGTSAADANKEIANAEAAADNAIEHSNHEDETLVSGSRRSTLELTAQAVDAAADGTGGTDNGARMPDADAPAQETHAQESSESSTTEESPTPAPLAMSNRWVVDLSADIYPELSDVSTPYVYCLQELWKDDPKEFVTELRALELMAVQLLGKREHMSSVAALNIIASRYMQDKRVLNGEYVPIEDLKAVLVEDNFTSDELRHAYVIRLFDHAREIRDTEAEMIIAHAMDADKELEAQLSEPISEALETHPDMIYSFARERLREGIDSRWLARLHTAAVFSLQVAINDGDAETLINWLKLLAREPESYELEDVFEQGILAAQERAHTDGDVGFQLLRLALRRAPDTVDRLLNDEALLEALPDGIAQALVYYDQEAINALQGRELFLVTLARALADGAYHVFTVDVIQQFWAIYTDDQKLNLPEQYQPETLLGQIITHGFDWLTDAALSMLLRLMLIDERFDTFRQTIPEIVAHDLSILAPVLSQSDRGADDLLMLIGGALANNHLTLQQAVNAYLQILADKEWSIDYLPVAEQVARNAQQNQSLIVPMPTVWQMLNLAAQAKSEIVGRGMARRVLAEIEKMESEKTLVSELVHLYDELEWSDTVQQIIQNWMRDYVRVQPLARLQQIDRAINGMKQLEDMREIVQTMIALRKMMGKRSLEEFADDIGNAYRILQALSESFDPQTRQPINFDSETVRMELDKRQDELTPDERKVLSKNLRELGGLIVNMAEHRSKATLIRREGDIERGLISGDQHPQSAIDMMKWLSGYLDGAHNED